jgi:16S rRNA (uracil1498-N3)-methyltransferase
MTTAETAARRDPRTPRFFVERLDDAQVLLLPADTRHATRSLRLEPGDELLLGDGKGVVGRGRLAGERGGRAVVDVVATSVVERPTPTVSVAFAPPANEGYRWALQKLTELGVDECVLTRTTRSVRRPDDGTHLKMHAVAREAAMQSRRPFLMALKATSSFDDALRYDGAVVLLSEDGDALLRDILPERVTHVRLLVGPEGGFTEQEVAAAGAAVATLGAPILRTETAAVAGAALVLHRYGRLG